MFRWYLRTFLVATGLIAVTAISPVVLAAGSSTAGQGLEISPPVMQLTANPGQVINTNISVRNITTGALIVNSQTNDFGASAAENGTPQILMNETGATRFSLKYWVTPISELTLAAGEMKSIPVIIDVPSNAEPGGHYGVVRFTGIPASMNTTGVSLSASVGTLILLTVNGNITHHLSVAQFSSGLAPGEDEWTSKSMFEHGPIDLLVRLSNTGSVHEAPHGSIVVKNMFGGVVGTLTVNAVGGNILPDSIRRWVQTLSQKSLFGYYSAALTMTYDTNKTVSGSTSFWVIPWALIGLVLVGLIVLGFLFKIGLKKYNEHIIAMARRR